MRIMFFVLAILGLIILSPLLACAQPLVISLTNVGHPLDDNCGPGGNLLPDGTDICLFRDRDHDGPDRCDFNVGMEIDTCFGLRCFEMNGGAYDMPGVFFSPAITVGNVEPPCTMTPYFLLVRHGELLAYVSGPFSIQPTGPQEIILTLWECHDETDWDFCEPPPSPSNFHASDGPADSGVVLSWNYENLQLPFVSDSFMVYRDTTLLAQLDSTLYRFVDCGAIPEERYEYRIRVRRNLEGEILLSPTVGDSGGWIPLESHNPRNPTDVMFSIYPSYPNPFNAVTSIVFEVSQPSIVRIAVFDVFGRETVRLHDGLSAPGRHELEFHAENLPSGTYFVHLQTPRISQTQKILLIR
ncbi:T9SS type A sorting domain-containing protein [bacterium]|nr:T9SS type A sorting domain-containing protein [bacterium]MBU1984203.1 T9SS type A sorting domain-containing protein [bacterium]